RVAVGGNLGVPVLDLLVEIETDLFVLELSSFQLETTYSLHAKIATILNITPDHLDRHETLLAYCQAKQRIYQHCELAVCNRDDRLTEATLPCKLYFTSHVPQEGEFGLLKVNGKTHLAFGDQPLLAIDVLPVLGGHYYMNALAALCIGYGYGFSMERMLQVLREFKGLPHRCELIRVHRQIGWYNDSKGTNVGATEAAIRGLGDSCDCGKLILIAGGVGKGADFSVLLPMVKQYVRHVILMGEAAQEIAQVIQGEVSCTLVGSMQDAVETANQVALPYDHVLLSPACASLDMFRNFEHRGEVFSELVRAL
ncbi:MAG: UDP-N-acetylmuramoylalanine-D-glutamate ligase, partial [uncultured bacterium]